MEVLNDMREGRERKEKENKRLIDEDDRAKEQQYRDTKERSLESKEKV